MGQLAYWKCHKIVRAGKITGYEGGLNGPVIVEDVNGVPCKIDMPIDAFKRGHPNIGDYIVVYEDGYKSWSPAKAFKEGYVKQ